MHRLLKRLGASSTTAPADTDSAKDTLDSVATVHEHRTKLHVPVEKTLFLSRFWHLSRSSCSTPIRQYGNPEGRGCSEITLEEDEELQKGGISAMSQEEADKKELGNGMDKWIGEKQSARRITLRLLGSGPRLYAVAGLIKVPVYALSLYAEASEAQARLLSTLPPTFDFSSLPPPSYYNALLSSSSSTSSAPWPRALYLTFCRSVGTKRVLDAFQPYPHLAAIFLPSIEASFKEAFGGAGIQAGDSVGFVWLEGEGLLTVINGRVVDLMEDEQLIPDIFSVWLGETPVSVEAKARMTNQAHWLRGETA
ncbi:chalcone isomerase [Nannochloropsis oceanica]